MDWSLLILLGLGGMFFLWRQSKNAEKAQAANERLASDNRLYQRIKTGMREYHFRERDWKAKDGQLLFETAHLCAYHVDHFAESRVGFYFKDIEEYGLYGFFAGNDDDVYHSYYRSDRTFKEEGQLLHDDD